MANESASGLQNAPDVIAGIIELLAAALLLFDARMGKGIGAVARVKRDSFLEQSLPLLRSAGAGAAADKFAIQMKSFESDMTRNFRTMKSGKYEVSYNERMAIIERSTQSVIRNLIQSGVRDGVDTKTIAQRLDRYINPVPGETPVRPWDVIRNASKANTSFIPKNVLPGSLQTNLVDIARTQTAESFRESTKRALDDAPWVLGYKWVLSSSHPRPDVCDELAAVTMYPKDGSKPLSHNFCLCDYIAVYASRAQVLELLQRGEL
jgi:hypothetical protein